MQATSTDFGLSFKTREVEVIVVEKLFTATFYNQTFKKLGQNVLVMKG